MGWIDADLAVVPVMRVTGGAQDAGCHRRGHLDVAAKEKRIFAPPHLQRFIDENVERVLLGPGDVKPQPIEQAAFADTQRVFGDVVEGDRFDKGGGIGRHGGVLRHLRKGVLGD